MKSECRTSGLWLATGLLMTEAGIHYLTGWSLYYLDPVVMLVGALVFGALFSWGERIGPATMWTALFAVYYGFFLHFLVAPHPVTIRYIAAYWPWWFVLLAAASAAEGAVTDQIRKLGDPLWRRYPLVWGPNHQAVMLPVWWLVAVDIMAKWGAFSRGVILRNAEFVPAPGLESWLFSFVNTWGIHGETAASVVASLTPLVILLAAYLVVGNAVFQAVRHRLAVGDAFFPTVDQNS